MTVHQQSSDKDLHQYMPTTYLNDLVSLTDILDTISQLDQPISSNEDDTLTIEEQADIIGTIIQMMYDYVVENPTHINNPTFHEDMMESVEELIRHSTFDADAATEDVDDETIADAMICLVDCAVDMFYVQIMPKRSTLMSESKTSSMSMHKRVHTRNVIANLQLKLQPAQRSNEWYAYRHALITASNAYKIFETPGAQNQLIYEKCAPLVVHVESSEVQDSKDKEQIQPTLQTFYINKHDDSNSHLVPTVNVTSPMHWGQKYEPLSTMYYEMIHGTIVGEYGCIQHDIYKFIGASPDGIVDDVKSEKYGQMLEIKNVVNRDITGIPAKAYWVQMQLQMEVCDLDECDFLETRFKEYIDRAAFNKDCAIATATATVPSNKTRDGKWKGALMYFIDAAGVPSYEYKPLTMEMSEFDTEWAPARRREHAQQGHRFMWSTYWWLEELSCVLVERNKLWFSLVIKEMSDFWDIILKERKTGYSHRAPAKRKTKDDGLFGQCLIMIPGQSPITTMSDNDDDSSRPKNVVHIRTQSFDDTVRDGTV